MTEGRITEWLVKPGDKIEEGGEFCMVETDKAIVTYESLEEGTIAKIFKPEGTSGIAIGEIIALMVDEGDDWENVQFDESLLVTAPLTAEIPQNRLYHLRHQHLLRR